MSWPFIPMLKITTIINLPNLAFVVKLQKIILFVVPNQVFTTVVKLVSSTIQKEVF